MRERARDGLTVLLLQEGSDLCIERQRGRCDRPAGERSL
jgi:hypothetical protein